MHDLLAATPDHDVDVHTVWLPVLGGSRMGDVALETIHGDHVTHYWDDDGEAALWFADNLPWAFSRPPAWDVFYLFDRNATWHDTPGEPVTWGYTIVAQFDDLEAALPDLLQ